MTVAPVIITVPGPLPYVSDKAVPWHYGADVYINGIKQELNAGASICDITGPAKVTRSGRLFSPDIAPPAARRPLLIIPTSTPIPVADQVVVPAANPIVSPAAESSNARGKGIEVEPARWRHPYP